MRLRCDSPSADRSERRGLPPGTASGRLTSSPTRSSPSPPDRCPVVSHRTARSRSFPRDSAAGLHGHHVRYVQQELEYVLECDHPLARRMGAAQHVEELRLSALRPAGDEDVQAGGRRRLEQAAAYSVSVTTATNASRERKPTANSPRTTTASTARHPSRDRARIRRSRGSPGDERVRTPQIRQRSATTGSTLTQLREQLRTYNRPPRRPRRADRPGASQCPAEAITPRLPNPCRSPEGGRTRPRQDLRAHRQAPRGVRRRSITGQRAATPVFRSIPNIEHISRAWAGTSRPVVGWTRVGHSSTGPPQTANTGHSMTFRRGLTSPR